MYKEKETYHNNLIVRNYSIENSPAGSPGKLFVNPSAIFVMRTNPDGSREVSLWNYANATDKSGVNPLARPFVKVISLSLADDEVADPATLLSTLKSSVSSIEVTKIDPISVNADALKKKIVVRYISNDELTALIHTVVGGYAEVGELIATDATTVPLDAAMTVLDASELLAEYGEPLSVSATFDVKSSGLNESVPTDAAENRPRPTLQEIEDEDPPEYVDSSRLKKKKSPNYWLLALFAAVALIIAWAVVSFLPTWLPASDYSKGEEMIVDESQPAPDMTDVPVRLADSAVVADTSAAFDADGQGSSEGTARQVQKSGESLDEKEDIAYLNSHKVWVRSDLKSEKYQEFYSSFAKGSIADLAQSDYFAEEGVMQNPDAEKVIDLLWAANGTGTQASNEKQLKRLKGKNKIDLHELYETLARYRDKNPNTSPRPKR